MSPRPRTPQPMPPIPPELAECHHFDSIRGDSEDSGLGASPTKSLGCCPSPVQFSSQTGKAPTAAIVGSNDHCRGTTLDRLCEGDLCSYDTTFDLCTAEATVDTTTSPPPPSPTVFPFSGGRDDDVDDDDVDDDLVEEPVASVSAISDAAGSAEAEGDDIDDVAGCAAAEVSSSSSDGCCRSTAESETQASTLEVPDVGCKWLDCQAEIECSSDLVEHIRQCHVETQGNNESYVCLWVGCKVYDRPSCSQSWLERHILSHGGHKPFKCIVGGCNQRFTSQSGLERHVNSHFNALPGPHGAKFARRDDTPLSKLVKKKKLRYRRRCLAVKTDDFFDDGIMEHVRHGLLEMSYTTGLDVESPPGTITFHSRVLARRVEGSGKAKVLLHWTPEDVLPDGWIPEAEISRNLHRTIPVSHLPREALVQLDPVYSAQFSQSSGKRKRK